MGEIVVHVQLSVQKAGAEAVLVLDRGEQVGSRPFPQTTEGPVVISSVATDGSITFTSGNIKPNTAYVVRFGGARITEPLIKCREEPYVATPRKLQDRLSQRPTHARKRF